MCKELQEWGTTPNNSWQVLYTCLEDSGSLWPGKCSWIIRMMREYKETMASNPEIWWNFLISDIIWYLHRFWRFCQTGTAQRSWGRKKRWINETPTRLHLLMEKSWPMWCLVFVIPNLGKLQMVCYYWSSSLELFTCLATTLLHNA